MTQNVRKVELKRHIKQKIMKKKNIVILISMQLYQCNLYVFYGLVCCLCPQLEKRREKQTSLDNNY